MVVTGHADEGKGGKNLSIDIYHPLSKFALHFQVQCGCLVGPGVSYI